MTANSVMKGHCANCAGERAADVVGEKKTTFSVEDEAVWGHEIYRLLECRGCETIYCQRENYVFDTGEEETTVKYWPAPSQRPEPKWTYKLRDNDLRSLFRSIYVALNNDLGVLAAIGIRTTFDRASELLGVDESKGFKEKLSELQKAGRIGRNERDTLDVLTDAGGAAAHRGWKPSANQLMTLMSIIEGFLERNFVLSDDVEELKQGIPPRTPRAVGSKPGKSSYGTVVQKNSRSKPSALSARKRSKTSKKRK